MSGHDDEFPAAVRWMAANADLTDLFCWHSMSRDGVWRWHASCKIDDRSCFVSEGADPIDAMYKAVMRAWKDVSNRTEPFVPRRNRK